MHADKLYHRMLEQEEAIEKAKKEGREPPKFGPLFDKKEEVKVDAETEKRWKDMLDKVPETARDAELEALKADRKSALEEGDKIESVLQQQSKEREARRAAGRETFGDKIIRMWLGK